MAFITAHIRVNETASSLLVKLYYPTDLPDTVGNEVKGVITLLHGLSNDPADWMQMSAACRYAADNGYVLVCPQADNSFYLDATYGAPWHTILAELLPAQLQRIFRLPTEREKNFIAGLSMGGYGALLMALRHPGRWAAAGSFSGAVDMSMVAQGARGGHPIGHFLRPIFGEDLQVPPEADLFQLAKQVSTLPREQQPRLYCSAGRQDTDGNDIQPQNQNLLKAVGGLPLDFTYEEWDGVHEWNFWDRSLARFIGFIQNSDYGRRKERDWSSPVSGCSIPGDV